MKSLPKIDKNYTILVFVIRSFSKPLTRPKGFSLIELLVVITIIAVLAIMGFAAFRSFTGRGNNDKRVADLKAIGDALEANKTAAAAGYQPLTDEQFANGDVPSETSPAGRTQRYCITSTTANPPPAIPANPAPAVWSGTACPNTGTGFTGAGSSDWTPLAAGLPAAPSTAWKVCLVMENNVTINCRNSAQ